MLAFHSKTYVQAPTSLSSQVLNSALQTSTLIEAIIEPKGSK